MKTNIIELDKLYKKPCEAWLNRFVDGKLDAHEAFKKYGQQYEWLYENSEYDLIGWEIENGCFNWRNNSWAVAKFCPEYIPLNKDKFKWERFSHVVAKYCPQYIDAERYNWEKDGWVVAHLCPQYLDVERYNWEQYSYVVAMYCPEYIDVKRYNWEKDKWAVEEFCPEIL